MRLVGLPRTTMDWDVYVPPRDEENFRKINAALKNELDMPVVPLGPQGENFVQTYQLQWGILQFYLLVPGLPSFEEAERSAVVVTQEGVTVKRLNGKMLLATKLASGRGRDEVDLKFLRALEAAGNLN